MKNILIFGATGRVGQRLVEFALADDFEVSVFVRDPSKLDFKHENLRIISGDVFNQEQVENAIKGQDYILSSLSGRSTKPDYSVLSIGIKNILSGMQKWGVKRLINVAGAGVLNDTEFGLRRNRPKYPEIFKLASAENWSIYQLLQSTLVNWTMVCAPEMPIGLRTGVYRTLPDFLPEGGSRIFVEDVADFMLKNLENTDVYQKRIGISY